MQDLKQLLSRYAHVGVSEKKKKEAVKKVLEVEYTISITLAMIQLQNNAVIMRVPASVRYTIHEDKKEILKKIAEVLGSSSEITDIR